VPSRICAGLLLGFITALLCQFRPAAAEQIVVSNYGVAANGMPYAIALKKGFFQQEGADITGILSSSGGGTTVRNLMEGNLPYGEVDLAGTVLAIQQGHR
jgi:NitT/TauT family transport system substrate-binding protein